MNVMAADLGPRAAIVVLVPEGQILVISRGRGSLQLATRGVPQQRKRAIGRFLTGGCPLREGRLPARS
jgi:hypothetical protein